MLSTVRDRQFSHRRVPCLGGHPMSVSLLSKQSLDLSQKAMTQRRALQLLFYMGGTRGRTSTPAPIFLELFP